MLGLSARIVPSTVTRARDSSTTSDGSRSPSSRQGGHQLLHHGGVDRAGARTDVLRQQPTEGPLELVVRRRLRAPGQRHDGLAQQSDVAP